MTWAATSLSRAAASFATVAAITLGAMASGPLVRDAHAAYASTPLSHFDARLLADINHARAAHGLRKLTVAAGTTDVAHGWACHLAARHLLAHNGRLASQLESHGSQLWTSYAENVGYVGASSGAGALFKAYMHSAPHRANILDRSARFIGIWSKRGGAYRYNTIDFVGATTRAYHNSYGAPRRTC
jgi:uncharacterized protein YkwD